MRHRQAMPNKIDAAIDRAPASVWILVIARMMAHMLDIRPASQLDVYSCMFREVRNDEGLLNSGPGTTVDQK